PSAQGSPQGQSGLEDLLRNIFTQVQRGQVQQAPSSGRQAAPTSAPQPQPGQPGDDTDVVMGKDLQDLLRQILEGRVGGGQAGSRFAQISRAVSEGGAGAPDGTQEASPAGGLAEALRQILGLAVAGA